MKFIDMLIKHRILQKIFFHLLYFIATENLCNLLKGNFKDSVLFSQTSLFLVLPHMHIES